MSEVRRSPERDAMERGFRRMAGLDRSDGIRPPVATSRALEPLVDPGLLPVRSARQLRVLEGPDAGAFYFVVGYSLVGGPDVVPEE